MNSDDNWQDLHELWTNLAADATITFELAPTKAHAGFVIHAGRRYSITTYLTEVLGATAEDMRHFLHELERFVDK